MKRSMVLFLSKYLVIFYGARTEICLCKQGKKKSWSCKKLSLLSIEFAKVDSATNNSFAKKYRKDCKNEN